MTLLAGRRLGSHQRFRFDTGEVLGEVLTP